MTAASKRYLGLIHRLPCEIWKPIPMWEGFYDVSNMGRVRSIGRTHMQKNGRHSYKPRILRPVYRRGYGCVALTRPGERSWGYIHRFVLLAFVGPHGVGQEACHGDGNRTNNRLSNLRWDSRSANNDDKRRHMTMPQGERHHNHKLTDDLVRELRSSSESTRSFARRTGIHVMTLSVARRGLTWKHVK